MNHLGFHLRRPTLEDAPAVCELVAICDTEDLGAPDIVLEDVLNMWSSFDLDQNVWVAEDENAALIGYAFLEEDSEEKLFSYGCVRPSARGKGVGTALVAALESRAVALRNESGQTKRLQGMIPSSCPDAAALFEGFGFAPVRYFKRMALHLEVKPAPVVLPEGFTVESFVKGRDEQAVYEAYIEAFSDHWDFTVPAMEKFVERTQLPTFDEHWWHLARDTEGAVAGFALCRMSEDLLFIEHLGVRRPHRGRGLALALLQNVFASSYQAGQTHVSLGVDAANPTGAYRLYEKVGMKPDYEISIYEKLIPVPVS
ncbi:GNAT family N-acetyltransferase [Paenibacillus timonensis]|uniref:GNAT family N-acetyltransferase n=1 Tax=Paenibacillus timonensis TaxID=225915 RepID=A0ABW3SBN3_9BACL|nr:GNAT family N-acetyltransferase [Paenibacillus timonensis]MCH1640428.1 GNAT family N-acetyltransferase [Paenibacillus timonensis]